jgi:iron complex transport system ATP-binding protein
MVVSGLFGTYGVLWGYDPTPEMFDIGREALADLEIPHLENRKLDTLSAGEHRRVFIARALVCRPRALVLDEPTTSLDIKSTGEFLHTMRRIARQGTTLVIVTHHFEEILPEIRRVILMRSGSAIADGSPEDVLTDELLSQAFNASLTLTSRNPFRAALTEDVPCPAL